MKKKRTAVTKTLRCSCCLRIVAKTDVRPGQIDQVHDAPSGHRCKTPYGCGPVGEDTGGDREDV